MKPFRALGALVLCLSSAPAFIAESMHPDFDLSEVPLPIRYKTMGMGVLSDGRLVLATSEFEGGGEVPKAPGEDRKILIIQDPGGPSPKVREIANTWLQPTGITIVHDTIYVTDRDGFYRISDNQPSGNLSGNRTKIAAWPDTTVWSSQGPSWHQWVFTPVYWQGSFYAPYSGSIGGGGWSYVPASTSYSGAFLKWDMSGKLERVAGGLRSPNGCGIGPTGEMFVTDNQGSWLPSSTFMLMKPGKFYGHRQSPGRNEQGEIVVANPPNFAESLPYERPTAWLDHGNLRNSPSQPVYLDQGTYAGDWLLGDVNNYGLVRVSLDEVDGTYNGCVFWFGKGFRSNAINRMAWGRDGNLYIGTITQIGNWPSGENAPLYRLRPKAAAAPAFDIRSVRHLADGVEITFTQAVDPATVSLENFPVAQWNYVRQEGYGLGKGQAEARTVSKVDLSADGKRVHLRIDSLKDDYVAYFKLGPVKSAGGASLWNNEAWFTLNKFSTRTWEPSVSLAPKAAPALAERARMAVTPGGLRVEWDGAGQAEAILRGLDGRALGAARGEGPLLLPTRGLAKGLYLLELRLGAGRSVRPIALGN